MVGSGERRGLRAPGADLFRRDLAPRDVRAHGLAFDTACKTDRRAAGGNRRCPRPAARPQRYQRPAADQQDLGLGAAPLAACLSRWEIGTCNALARWLVTGAQQGIGRAMAIEFAAAG